MATSFKKFNNHIFIICCRVDKSTICKIVRDVTDAIVARTEHFIRWPVSSDDTTAIKTGFYAQACFLNVIGCTDGTHVRILAPSEDENAYVNRKGFHSINVQAMTIIAN